MFSSVGNNPNMFFSGINSMLTGKHHNVEPTGSATVNNSSNSSNSAIVTLNTNALLSSGIRLPGGGWMSASVFKSENSTGDNPMFLVKGSGTDGKPFEAEIRINDINPRNASFIEMLALDGYYASKGQSLGAARSAAGAMSGIRGSHDELSKFDFISALKEMMETQRINQNLGGFSHFRQIVDLLLEH